MIISSLSKSLVLLLNHFETLLSLQEILHIEKEHCRFLQDGMVIQPELLTAIVIAIIMGDLAHIPIDIFTHGGELI